MSSPSPPPTGVIDDFRHAISEANLSVTREGISHASVQIYYKVDKGDWYSIVTPFGNPVEVESGVSISIPTSMKLDEIATLIRESMQARREISTETHHHICRSSRFSRRRTAVSIAKDFLKKEMPAISSKWATDYPALMSCPSSTGGLVSDLLPPDGGIPEDVLSDLLHSLRQQLPQDPNARALLEVLDRPWSTPDTQLMSPHRPLLSQATKDWLGYVQ